jgi:hypothetical protein
MPNDLPRMYRAPVADERCPTAAPRGAWNVPVRREKEDSQHGYDSRQQGARRDYG